MIQDNIQHCQFWMTLVGPIPGGRVDGMWAESTATILNGFCIAETIGGQEGDEGTGKGFETNRQPTRQSRKQPAAHQCTSECRIGQ